MLVNTHAAAMIWYNARH